MRSLPRFAALCALFAIATVPAAIAAPPGDGARHPGDAADTGKPGKPGKPGEAGRPDSPGNSGNAPGRGVKGDTALLPEIPVAMPRHQPGIAHPEFTELGETASVGVNHGMVKVKLPSSDQFVELGADTPIPVGASVDARGGLVTIGTEAADGVEQHAVMTGSVFRIEQPDAVGTTDLVLEGGDFDVCNRPSDAARKTVAHAARKRKSNIVRGMWGAGKGRFRTRGRHAVATVRGTRWATVDRCHSTTVKVYAGVVDVRDRLSGKKLTLRTGERHVASKLAPR